MKDDYYWFWINNITGIANIKLRYLFKVFDTPEDIYKASDKMFEGVMGIKPDDIYSIKESRKSEYIYREYSELDKKNIVIENYDNSSRQIPGMDAAIDHKTSFRVNIIILKD